MVKKKVAKFLAFRYKILALVFIILAGGLVFLPKYKKHEGIKPEELLSNVINPERYISTDELAHKIIVKDPSIILVDVRSKEDYKNYTISNAINIPLNKLLDEESELYLNQDQYDIVLFSNDNFYADQAWVLCNRLGYKNIKVLAGGVNQWFSTIINPPIPTENMAAVDFEKYTFRKAASMHFGVVYPEQIKVDKPVVVKKAAPKKVVTIEKKKKAPVEGGC